MREAARELQTQTAATSRAEKQLVEAMGHLAALHTSRPTDTGQPSPISQLMVDSLLDLTRLASGQRGDTSSRVSWLDS